MAYTYADIESLQKAYQAATSDAERTAIHNQANAIRDAMGISSQYDRDTGASLLPSKVDTSSIIPSPTSSTQATVKTSSTSTPSSPPSLLPMPNAPTYTPYNMRSFIPEPPGYSITTQGNTSFTPTLAAKAQWNQQEQTKANLALQQYQADLQKYNTSLNAWKARNEDAWNKYQFGNLSAAQQAQIDQNNQNRADKYMESYYNSAGLIAPLYPGDPSATIRYWQGEWQKANEIGDQAGMDHAHKMAEQARQTAGWGSGGDAGSLTAGIMTQSGLPTAASTRQAAIDQADLAVKNAQAQLYTHQANAPYSASGSGGTTTYQKYQMDRNDQQDLQKIYDKARELTQKDQRVLDDPSKTDWVYNSYVDNMLTQNPHLKQVVYQQFGITGGNPR